MAFEIPTLPCRLCGTECSLAYEYELLGGIPVCGECAGIIANIYSKKHSGEYLTWPNQTARPAYVKKPIPDNIRWRILERDNFTCLACGARRFLEIDHIYPEILGGGIDPENLQTLCRPCNASKGAKTPAMQS